jgi:hypothetical protein
MRNECIMPYRRVECTLVFHVLFRARRIRCRVYDDIFQSANDGKVRVILIGQGLEEVGPPRHGGCIGRLLRPDAVD